MTPTPTERKGKLVRQHRYYTRLQARLMAGNQDFEIEDLGQDELAVEILNPEQLAQENQALKTKVDAMEAQMAEVMGMLQNLRDGAAAGATAVVSPEGFVTFVAPPVTAEVTTAHTTPGPEVSPFAHSPGVNGQSHPNAQIYSWGMPLGYVPSVAEAVPVGSSQPAMVVPNGVAMGPQVHTPGPGIVLPRSSSSPTPGVAVNPQKVVHHMGNPAQHGGYYHSPGNYPQGHLVENTQQRDRYHLLEERLRAMEGSGTRARDARELRLVPDVVIPPKFKAPDFDKYCGTGCPSSHLTMYVRKMAAYAHDEKVLIHYFQNSLTEASLGWYMQLQSSDIHSWRDLSKAFLKQYQYNMDLAPDRSQLQHMSKGEKETFKEYAQKWRSIAAQVQPPMTEKEMVNAFLKTLPTIYYDRLITSVSTSFSDMIVFGEKLEHGLRNGKISNHLSNAGNSDGSNSQKKHHSHLPKQKEGETNVVSGGNSSFGAPPPQTVPFSAPVPFQQGSDSQKAQGYQYKKRTSFDPIPMTYTELFNHLTSKNLINTRPMKAPQPPFPQSYNTNATCSFHENGVGHTVEECKAFRHVVQDLVDAGWISFKQNSPNTTTNPLPGHERSAINAIESPVGRLIRKVEKVKTPLEVIHAELCKFGVIKRGCTQKGVCVDCAGACEAFKTVLQDLLDRQVTQIGVQEYKDGRGLGYQPIQADKKRVAEEKQERRLAKLQRRGPNLKKVPIYDPSLSIPVCDIRQSFVSAGLLDHNQVTVIKDGPESEEGGASRVCRCGAGERIKELESC